LNVDLREGSFGALGIFPEPTHHWTLPDGRVWLSFSRAGESYWLRFPGLSDYLVSPDGHQVWQYPVTGTDTATLEHLFLNQVLPLAQSLQGALVFHASAVTVGTGAVAFLGHSGRGKSTLAASFAANGESFLTDDGLQLIQQPDGYWVEPSHPSIRLWDDSREALIHRDATLSSPVQYTFKARVLSDTLLSSCRERRPLRRVYFLGEGLANDVVIQPVKPSQALISLVNHSFVLDTASGSAMGRHFDALSRMVELPIFFTLDYPRQYDMLDQVRTTLARHVNDCPIPT